MPEAYPHPTDCPEHSPAVIPHHIPDSGIWSSWGLTDASDDSTHDSESHNSLVDFHWLSSHWTWETTDTQRWLRAKMQYLMSALLKQQPEHMRSLMSQTLWCPKTRKLSMKGVLFSTWLNCNVLNITLNKSLECIILLNYLTKAFSIFLFATSFLHILRITFHTSGVFGNLLLTIMWILDFFFSPITFRKELIIWIRQQSYQIWYT